jgi:phosphotransferase system enzyme I (PtsI)
MLRLIARAGRRARIPVAVCGEMAADPASLMLLVGLGLREFSMAPTALAMAKQVLRGTRADDAQRVASRALRRRTAAEVHQCIIELLGANTVK